MSLNMAVREVKSDEKQLNVGPLNNPIPLSYTKQWTVHFIPKRGVTAEELEKQKSHTIDEATNEAVKGIDKFIDEKFITTGRLLNRRGYNIVHMDALIPFCNYEGEEKRIEKIRNHYEEEFDKYYTQDRRFLEEKAFASGVVKNISVKDEIDVNVYQADKDHFDNYFEVFGTRILSFELGNRLFSVVFDEKAYFAFYIEHNKIEGVIESDVDDDRIHGGMIVLSTKDKSIELSKLYDQYLSNDRSIEYVGFNGFFNLLGKELYKMGLVNMPGNNVER